MTTAGGGHAGDLAEGVHRRHEPDHLVPLAVLAERHLAARFNRDGLAVVDHHTYFIAGDGDLMEGISSEAASLAGHLGLGNLIYFYDDNNISIEGETRLAFSEDVKKRFESAGR